MTEKRTDSWFQKETKEEGVTISVVNVFLPMFPSWFIILNNLLIMDSLIGIMDDFVSRCSHFVPPEIIQVTFGFLMFSGSIKEEH